MIFPSRKGKSMESGLEERVCLRKRRKETCKKFLSDFDNFFHFENYL